MALLAYASPQTGFKDALALQSDGNNMRRAGFDVKIIMLVFELVLNHATMLEPAYCPVFLQSIALQKTRKMNCSRHDYFVMKETCASGIAGHLFHLERMAIISQVSVASSGKESLKINICP